MVNDKMLEKFLKQTQFKDYADFMANFKVVVPEDFNFGYDVVDTSKRIFHWKINFRSS